MTFLLGLAGFWSGSVSCEKRARKKQSREQLKSGLCIRIEWRMSIQSMNRAFYDKLVQLKLTGWDEWVYLDVAYMSFVSQGAAFRRRREKSQNKNGGESRNRVGETTKRRRLHLYAWNGHCLVLNVAFSQTESVTKMITVGAWKSLANSSLY